jgi:mannose-6-phosphate isomerase-like protein (cupin superfamily)
VNIQEVSGGWELGAPDDGVTDEERETARAEIKGDATAIVDIPGYPEMRPRRWHALRRHLGISAFGINVVEADAGSPLINPHTEVLFGQEEVYLVLDGRVRFHCDGEEVEAGPGELLYLPPEVVRGAVALETPTAMLMLGGQPGAYEPPIWAADWRPPDEWLAAHRADGTDA